ncbi:MAG: M20/M25/M40 family metallo-hydrolase [Eggerthellaceae bacterium]|nr:M20/M25/M40 family metallo-hydrolase [Eggerthellaceae bacterium]
MDSERLIDTFVELAKIASPSRHEAVMRDALVPMLEELGFAVTIDDSAAQTGSDTGNIIALLPGTVPGRIAFSAHMDTVEPCENIRVKREMRPAGQLAQRPVDAAGNPFAEDALVEVLCSAGDTILSGDDKAGIAAILEGVRTTLEKGTARPDIQLVFTTCEEISLVGASALADDTFAPGTPCFVLDANGRPGSIVTAAPCHFTFFADFYGTAAHAGICPEQGISAIHMAADAIDAMQLGRINERTTANVGFIEGGHTVNVIPEHCHLRGECRSLVREEALAQRDAMTAAMEAAAEAGGGRVEITWEFSYPEVAYNAEDPLVIRIKDAARLAGLVPRRVTTGGGADANVMGEKGARAITLGIGMTDIHSEDEYIAVRDVEGCAKLVEMLIALYARDGQRL